MGREPRGADAETTVAVDSEERRTAVASFVAAAAMVVTYLHSLVYLPMWQHQKLQDAWTRLPEAVNVLVLVGVPALGGILLLAEQTRRRQIGAAVVATFGTYYLFALPSRLFSFSLDGPSAHLVSSLLFLLFTVSAAVAGALAIVLLVRSPAVWWSDPRRVPHSGTRLALLAAIVVTGAAAMAPWVSMATPIIWDRLLAGGVNIGQVLSDISPLLLVAATWLIIGTVIVGVRPTRVAAAAGAVVAAIGISSGVSNVIANLRMGALEGPGVAWLMLHALAVAVLIGAVARLWRSVDDDATAEKAPRPSANPMSN